MSDATAILLFVQPLAHDAARKHLANQPLPNRRVLEQLNQRIRQTAEATHLPVLHSAHLITHNGTFGEQVTGAVQAVFARGFERVLVIGNDCPALTTANLLRAADCLQANPVVLGPDRRGGLYLLGLSRMAFEQTALASLPWQTNRLTEAAGRRYAGWPVAVLSPLGDINNHFDLRHYQASTPTVAAFIGLLQALGASEQTDFVHTQPARPIGLWISSGSLRAPPAPYAAIAAA